MTYQAGDLVLLAFPFTSGTKAKRRPALVILDVGDADILVARVTTRPYQTHFDIALEDWQSAGLLAASVVRVHKVPTLERTLVERQLGQVSAADRSRIADVLARTYSTWGANE
jgi:mRNA interferase MazF